MPSAKIGQPALVATSVPDSSSGYSTSTTHTLTVSGPATSCSTSQPAAPCEVVYLANALNKNIDEIYDFVRNYVDTVFIFGAQKGALGAIIDKSGTPFDQAELMVALAQQAGYTANYQFGTITLTGAQFAAWTNITTAQAACSLLANGGIPASINGSSSTILCSSLSVTASVTSVTMYHVWVQVTGLNDPKCGNSCIFDPSYKAYNFVPQVSNLNSAAGLTTGQALAAATGSGYTTGTAGSPAVTYVKNLTAPPLSEALCGASTSGLTAQLCTYAANLQSYIQNTQNTTTDGPLTTPGPLLSAKIIDLVGGREILRCGPPSCEPVRQSSLPYSASNVTRTWTGALPTQCTSGQQCGVPDQFRASLTVTLTKANSSGTFNTTINALKLFADDIYGRKLVYEPNFGYRGQAFVGSLELVDEFGNTTTLPNSSYSSSDNPGFSVGTLTIAVNHPYLADDAGSLNPTGTYMDITMTRTVRYMTPFLIVHGWGETNRGLVDKWSQRPDSQFIGLYQPNGCDTCEVGHHGSEGDGRREQLAALWLMQSSKAARMHASIANAIYTHHHTVGIVSGDTEMQATNTNPPGSPPNIVYSVTDNLDRIDADTGFSVTSTTSNTSDRRVAIQAIAATNEELEGSVAAQQVDLPDTVSTATRFEWGNAPPAAEDPSGANGTSIGPRAFFDFNSTNVGSCTAGSYSFAKAESLMLVEGKTTTTESDEHGGGEPTIGPLETGARLPTTPSVLVNYACQGFDVVASDETFLGPGQRGGAYMKQSDGLYMHRYSKQRGGAFVATLYNSNGDPVQIAHVAVNLNYSDGTVGIKGGGGGTQPDQQSLYDPAMAADVLKANFVDRSKVLGVDLQTGMPTWTSPALLDVGSGKFPYSLSASLSWRGGIVQDQTFDEVSHVAPNTPWTTNWNNSLSISGSALEAMGDTDIRAAAATVAAFMAMQDIYRSATSPQRTVAAVLVGAWWTHQIRGNVASVSLGTDTRQFLRKYDGTWFSPGPGDFATLAQTGQRAVYVQPNCPQMSSGVSYVLTRGWDYSGVSFAVTNANGDQQNFSFWGDNYWDGVSYCAWQHGFRISSWTFPYGMAINFTYQPSADGLDELYEVTNTLGRSIHFTTSGFAGVDNTLTGSDARSVAVSIPFSGASETDTTTDPAGATTSINWTLTGYRYELNNVLTADNATVPSLEYKYDPLERVQSAYDAVALRKGSRGPYSFTYGEQTRGERTDPATGVYTVLYDIYRRPLSYIDELGNATSLMHDGRGRVTSYTYPEGNEQVLTYDDHNNTASLQRIAKVGSGITFAPIQAVWNQTWNKPSSITDSMGCQTIFAYVPSGTNGTSLLQTATRCKPDSTQSNPVYQFTYNAYGQTLTTTEPTGLQVTNAYDTLSNYSNLLTTALDPTGIDAITSYTYDANGNVSTVTDPRSYATLNQYDNDRRKTFSYHYNGATTTSLLSAEHTVYDVLGRDIEEASAIAVSGTSVTTWQPTKTTSYTDDSKVYQVEDGAGDTTTHTYDSVDREDLVTDPVKRMVGTVYDLAGHVLCLWHAWNSTTAPSTCGTPSPSTYNGSAPFQYAAYTYSPNGNRLTELDANNNLTTLTYDGVDRLSQTIYPMPTEASGKSDTTDTEAYTYDSNDNRLTFKTRDSYTLSYTYDALNRKTVKTVPAGSQSTAYTVYYGYDLSGRPTCIHFGSTSGTGNVVCSTGTGIAYTYDTARRVTSEINTLDSPTSLAMSYTYDKASNRTAVTWPDTNYLDYDFDGLNRVYQIRENGATSGVGVLVVYGYDPMSHLTSVTRGNGTSSSLQYDLASRLIGLSHTMASQSESLSFLYTPATQLLTRSGSNASYDYVPAEASRSYTANGLNVYASVGGTTYSNDQRGNLTSDGTRTLAYDLENHLLSVAGGAGLTLQYDPLGRIWQTTSGSTVTQFLYDGTRLVAEYSSGGTTVLQRYAHGPRADDPEVWYEGAAMTTREWLHSDERGSVIAATDSTGTPTIYTYGPYGEPTPAWTGSRFRYTGQTALPEAQLYNYKVRVYDPGVGRFFQTDPIGTKDDLNLYAYVYNDPTDRTDPTGTLGSEGGPEAATPVSGEEFLSFVLDSLPIVGEYRAISSFIDHPTLLGAGVIGASVLDLGGTAKVAASDLRTAGRADFSASKAAALKENGGVCVYCNKNPATEGDHVKSLKAHADDVNAGRVSKEDAAKAANAPENVVGACPGCNRGKAAKELSNTPGPGKYVPSNPTPKIQNICTGTRICP